jgi:hypothetical protein
MASTGVITGERRYLYPALAGITRVTQLFRSLVSAPTDIPTPVGCAVERLGEVTRVVGRIGTGDGR